MIYCFEVDQYDATECVEFMVEGSRIFFRAMAQRRPRSFLQVALNKEAALGRAGMWHPVPGYMMSRVPPKVRAEAKKGG